MAKSWGARIVRRLFGSRSHKQADVERDEAPTLEDSVKDSLLQQDSEPYEDLLTKDSEKGLNQIEPKTGDETAPTKGNTEAQMNVGRPHTLEKPTLSVQRAKENADEPVTRLSNSEPMPKPSPVRVHKSQNGPLHDMASGVGAGPATDETSDGQSVVSNDSRKQKIDHGARRKVANKASTKEPSKADIKPKYRAEELVSNKDTAAALEPSREGRLKVGQGSERNSALPKGPNTALKRSRKPKPKAMDEQVTDKELAELEAENARLKRLLRQKQRTI